jgi:hypothetical protein
MRAERSGKVAIGDGASTDPTSAFDGLPRVRDPELPFVYTTARSSRLFPVVAAATLLSQCGSSAGKASVKTA